MTEFDVSKITQLKADTDAELIQEVKAQIAEGKMVIALPEQKEAWIFSDVDSALFMLKQAAELTCAESEEEQFIRDVYIKTIDMHGFILTGKSGPVSQVYLLGVKEDDLLMKLGSPGKVPKH